VKEASYSADNAAQRRYEIDRRRGKEADTDQALIQFPCALNYSAAASTIEDPIR
jgi:hypothetical protein